ncbi:MAG: glutathione S-transferase family protein [Candidatus Omnitrophica bacterium]|nr:glutathione S-transferase family protein [Candidatus Omnitrophota bacterium]
MLTIYGSDLSAPANKVRFAANAIGVKYEYKRVDLRAGDHLKPEFLAVNPVGKVPAVDDGGFRMFESNAIIRYLADKNNSPLYPRDLRERAVVDMWLDFGSMHVGTVLSKVIYNRIFVPLRGLPADENSLQEGLKFLERFLPVVDGQLAKNKYIAGAKFTLADINLLALFDPCEIAAIDISPYKNIVRWRAALRKEKFYTDCHQAYGVSLKERLAAVKAK